MPPPKGLVHGTGLHPCILHANQSPQPLRLGRLFEWLVRSGAAYTLGWIEPDASEAVAVLLQALRDESEYVRSNAADALGEFGARCLRWPGWAV